MKLLYPTLVILVCQLEGHSNQYSQYYMQGDLSHKAAMLM